MAGGDNDDLVIDPTELEDFGIDLFDPGATTESAIGMDDIVLDRSEIALNDSEDPEKILSSQRVAIGPDRKPVIGTQGVDYMTRLRTQLFFDNSDEKQAYLKSVLGPGYVFAQHPKRPNDVILRRKDQKHWSVVDPGGLGVGELIAEVGENSDSIASMAAVPAGALNGAMAAGGIQAVRQAIKHYLLPEASIPGSIEKVGVDALAGGIGGGAAQLLGKTAKATKDASSVALATGKGIVAKADEPLLSRVKQGLNILKQPRFIAQELGATDKAFLEVGRKPITENIQWLMDESPEFAQAISTNLSRKGKFSAVQKLVSDTGDDIARIYNETPAMVQLDDVLDSPAYAALKDASTTGRIMKGKKRLRLDAKEAKHIDNTVRRNMLDTLGGLVMGEEGDAAGGFLEIFRAGKLHEVPALKEMGAKTNNDAMELLLRQQEIPLLDAWGMRMAADEKINYFKNTKQISWLNSSQKLKSDTMRDAIMTTLNDQFPDTAADLIHKNELFHQLMPVLTMTDAANAAGKASPISFTKYWPGSLNSGIRRTAMFGTKALNTPQVRTLLRNIEAGGGIPIPQGAQLPEGGLKKMLPQMLRGNAFLTARSLMDRQLSPRDAKPYFDDPNLINDLTGQVDDPELTDSMVRKLESGDQEGFANMLSMVASGNPDVFDPAPYASLVTNNGKPVIMDKYDREAYRKYLDQAITDPRDRFLALKALNFSNEMTKPPFTPPEKAVINKPAVRSGRVSLPKGSKISRVVEDLKANDDADTVRIDNDTKRADYEY